MLANLDARDQPEPDDLLRALEHYNLAPSVRFGIELAAYNLYAVALGKTLPEVLGPRPGAKVSLNGLLAGPTEEVLKEARRMRSVGYRAAKLKVGRGSVEEDAALVREVVGVLGENVSLRLDANRAWRFGEALKFVRVTEGVRYEYVEEPLAEPTQLSRLVDETGIPVALDESLVGVNPETLGEHRYARAVVLKPTLLGSIRYTLRLAEMAQSLGMIPVVSSAFETGIGTLGLVALAACIGGGEVPAGLDTYRRYAADVLEPRLDLPAHVGVSGMMEVRRAVNWNLLREIRDPARATRGRDG